GFDLDVAFEGAQVFVDAKQGEGPGARACELCGGRQSGVEKLARQAGPARIVPVPDQAAQGPQGAAVAVFRAAVLGPLAGVGHEVAEPSELLVEGVVDEGQVAGNQGPNNAGLSDLGIFNPAHQQKGAG